MLHVRGPVKRVGVISDTHGLMRPEALEALEGCDLILHAGDVGAPDVLEALSGVAPVHAVRGNVDRAPWTERLPATEVVPVEDVTFYVLHILDELDLDPVAAGFGAVVFGHTHRAECERRRGVLYLNPGPAGPRERAPSVALAEVRGAAVDVRHVRLDS